jgi:two-component system, OmpR family, sensor kinase
MFLSIRSRLWLSYVAVIVLTLAIVAIVVTAFLIENPYTYRQAAVRIAAAESLVRQDSVSTSRMAIVAEGLGVRILVLSPSGVIRSDTAPDQSAFRNLANDRRARQAAVTRDLSGNPWLYSKQRLPNGDWQIVATPRPGILPVLDVLRDELWRPIMRAGLAALLLALILAYLLARWIADPMQALIHAARSISGAGAPAAHASEPTGEMPGGDLAQERGPQEVRELTRAFNAMLSRVAATQRSQKAFVADVSHELKTPLTAIQGFSQALLDGTAASEESRRQAAEIIQREAARIFRLATDLLELARLDSGGVEMRRETVDLAQLLVGLQERYEPVAAAAGVQLEMQAAQDLDPLVGDGERLAQALGNIIENAIKFTPSGGRVWVQTDVLPGEICVVISDTGPGIPEADLERVFDRFYQVDRSRGGGAGHGAGLGLAIAREVVEGHSGRIHVRSTLGHGAEFQVHLPRGIGSRDQRRAD